MKRKIADLAAPSIVLAFLPIALLELMASVNEYHDQGISGAVDCNGPLTVLSFVAPSLVVYVAGAVYYTVVITGGRRSLLTVVLLLVCVLMSFATGRKAWAAYREKNRSQHQLTCGEGW